MFKALVVIGIGITLAIFLTNFTLSVFLRGFCLMGGF
jgi:hypothetical protein